MKIIKCVIVVLACLGAITALIDVISGTDDISRYGELIGDGVIIGGVLLHGIKKKANRDE